MDKFVCYAKLADEDTSLYGYPFTQNNEYYIYTNENKEYHKVLPESIRRFTGKYDIDDVPIFEGDLVHLVNTPYITTVQWCDKHAGWHPFVKNYSGDWHIEDTAAGLG